jgi:hypothetical protein
MAKRHQVEDLNPFKAIQPTQQITDTYISPGHFEIPQNEMIDVARSLAGFSPALQQITGDLWKDMVERETEEGLAQVNTMTEEELDSFLAGSYQKAGVPVGATPNAMKSILQHAGATQMRFQLENWGYENFLRYTDPENRDDPRQGIEEFYNQKVSGIESFYAKSAASGVLAEFTNNYVAKIHQSRIVSTEKRLKEDHHDRAYTLVDRHSSTLPPDKLNVLVGELIANDDALYHQNRIQARDQVATALLTKATDLAKNGEVEAAEQLLSILEEKLPGYNYDSEVDEVRGNLASWANQFGEIKRERDNRAVVDFVSVWFSKRDRIESMVDPQKTADEFDAAVHEQFGEDPRLVAQAMGLFKQQLGTFSLTEVSNQEDLNTVWGMLNRPEPPTAAEFYAVLNQAKLTEDDKASAIDRYNVVRDMSRGEAQVRITATDKALEASKNAEMIELTALLADKGLSYTDPDVRLWVDAHLANRAADRRALIEKAIGDLSGTGVDWVEAAGQVGQKPPTLPLDLGSIGGEMEGAINGVRELEMMATQGTGSEDEFNKLLEEFGRYSSEGPEKLREDRRTSGVTRMAAFRSTQGNAAGLVSLRRGAIKTIHPDAEFDPNGEPTEPAQADTALDFELGFNVELDRSLKEHTQPGVSPGVVDRLVWDDLKAWRDRWLDERDPTKTTLVGPPATKQAVALVSPMIGEVTEPTMWRADSDFLHYISQVRTEPRPDVSANLEKEAWDHADKRIQELHGVTASSDKWATRDLVRDPEGIRRGHGRTGRVGEWKGSPQFLQLLKDIGGGAGTYETGAMFLRAHFRGEWNPETGFGANASSDLDIRTTEYLYARSLSSTPLSVDELEAGYAQVNGVNIIELPDKIYNPAYVRFYSSPDEAKKAYEEWDKAPEKDRDETEFGRRVLLSRNHGQRWPRKELKDGEELAAGSPEAFLIHQLDLLAGKRRKK